MVTEAWSPTSIQDCQATDPADKETIMRQIRDSVGYEEFDRQVASAVVPVVRGISMHRCVQSSSLAARSGAQARVETQAY